MLRAIVGTISNVCRVNVSIQQISRSLSISSRLCLKEIREREEGGALVIEGVYIKSPREDFLLRQSNDGNACPLCAARLLVRHTDVLIIKQFVDDFGKLLPRNYTGLCRWQHRRMQYVLEMAVRAGLVNDLLPPDEPIPQYQKGWRKFNSYYDEKDIPASKSEKSLKFRQFYEQAYALAKAEKDAHEEKLKTRVSRRTLPK